MMVHPSSLAQRHLIGAANDYLRLHARVYALHGDPSIVCVLCCLLSPVTQLARGRQIRTGKGKRDKPIALLGKSKPTPDPVPLSKRLGTGTAEEWVRDAYGRQRQTMRSCKRVKRQE